MPFHYSTDFRRRACERLSAGGPVSKLTKELSVSSATLFRWKKQVLIVVGRITGVKSYEVKRTGASVAHHSRPRV
jgi:transposase-like protein